MKKYIGLICLGCCSILYASDMAPAISSSTQVAISPDTQALDYAKAFFNKALDLKFTDSSYKRINFNLHDQHD